MSPTRRISRLERCRHLVRGEGSLMFCLPLLLALRDLGPRLILWSRGSGFVWSASAVEFTWAPHTDHTSGHDDDETHEGQHQAAVRDTAEDAIARKTREKETPQKSRKKRKYEEMLHEVAERHEVGRKSLNFERESAWVFSAGCHSRRSNHRAESGRAVA